MYSIYNIYNLLNNNNSNNKNTFSANTWSLYQLASSIFSVSWLNSTKSPQIYILMYDFFFLSNIFSTYIRDLSNLIFFSFGCDDVPQGGNRYSNSSFPFRFINVDFSNIFIYQFYTLTFKHIYTWRHTGLLQSIQFQQEILYEKIMHFYI